MPEFTVKEVHLPELKLPELKRDDIVRALSGVHLPEVDLARARSATLMVPSVRLTSTDLGRLLAAGTAITRFIRPARNPARFPLLGRGRRSRSPLALIVRPRTGRSRRRKVLAGIAIAAIATAAWALLTRPQVRDRLERIAGATRERFETWRARDLQPEEPQGADTTAGFDTIPGTPSDPGSDGIPTFEAAETRS